MKIIGVVGGMGPEASLYYYRLLIDLKREAQKTINPDIGWIIYNAVPMPRTANVTRETSGTTLSPERKKAMENPDRLLFAIEGLHRAGADFAIIACNTVHSVFDEVKAKSPLPLLSIVEETCGEVAGRGISKAGLFGSMLTMQGHFYQDVFNKRGIPIVVPKPEEQAYIDKKVFEELVRGLILDETREEFLKIVQRMIDEESIEGLILGCTEIPLLLTKDELGIPFFDTSKIHAESAFRYALALQDT